MASVAACTVAPVAGLSGASLKARRTSSRVQLKSGTLKWSRHLYPFRDKIHLDFCLRISGLGLTCGLLSIAEFLGAQAAGLKLYAPTASSRVTWYN